MAGQHMLLSHALDLRIYDAIDHKCMSSAAGKAHHFQDVHSQLMRWLSQIQQGLQLCLLCSELGFGHQRALNLLCCQKEGNFELVVQKQPADQGLPDLVGQRKSPQQKQARLASATLAVRKVPGQEPEWGPRR